MSLRRSFGSSQVLLQPHLVGFLEPTQDLVIQFGRISNLEVMDMISWRKGLDLEETRVFESPGEDDVRAQPIALKLIDRCKYHPGLKTNSRFRRSQGDWSDPPDELLKCSI
ncbi:MAG TPA: hypothetical protein VEZ90_01065 [Blastocatellia bacterium]|nr:hypothetical protein [Blastocatellia bacterium]